MGQLISNIVLLILGFVLSLFIYKYHIYLQVKYQKKWPNYDRSFESIDIKNRFKVSLTLLGILFIPFIATIVYLLYFVYIIVTIIYYLMHLQLSIILLVLVLIFGLIYVIYLYKRRQIFRWLNQFIFKFHLSEFSALSIKYNRPLKIVFMKLTSFFFIDLFFVPSLLLMTFVLFCQLLFQIPWDINALN